MCVAPKLLSLLMMHIRPLGTCLNRVKAAADPSSCWRCWCVVYMNDDVAVDCTDAWCKEQYSAADPAARNSHVEKMDACCLIIVLSVCSACKNLNEATVVSCRDVLDKSSQCFERVPDTCVLPCRQNVLRVSWIYHM